MNAKAIISAHFRKLGAIGGRSKSAKKLRAIRNNGKLGGRPVAKANTRSIGVRVRQIYGSQKSKT
jgi:hypothetical protein